MRVAHNVVSFIEDRDHRLMRRCNRWRAPKWVRMWMICATRGGDGWLWCTLGAAVLLFGGPERWRTVLGAALAAAAGIWVFLVMKRAANRKRPCALEPHCWATLLPPDQFSFPSGHSMTAFAVCVPVMLAYPGAVAGLLLCAVSIAASRVILGMHFLSDVVVGSLLGALLGYAGYAAAIGIL